MLLSAFASAAQAASPDETGQDTPAVAAVSSSIQPTQNSAQTEENSEAEVLWEWDLYYTSVGLNIPLTEKPIPTISSNSETVIYRELLKGSAIPRYMTLEASIYPMPILGTYLKKRTPGFYDHGQIGGSSINLIDSVTAGFQEPWAVSLFLGNLAKLERPGETRTGTNMGYTGYLLSGGTKHIKNNVLIDDNWFELEWKIKGKRDYPDEKMSWSFRFGGKFNSHPEITDAFYFSIHRSNLDHRAPFLHWLKNISLDAKAQFSQHGGQVIREEFIIGKKYPIEGESYSATLNVGVVWESPNEYIGALRDRKESKTTLLIRPSVEF